MSVTALGIRIHVACTVHLERKENRGKGNLPSLSGKILALATDPADAYEDSRAKPFVRRYL